MAYVNISISEIMKFIEKNVEYNRDRIKEINIVNENHVELFVSVGPFFPTIKVVLVYNNFENGKLYLNVLTNGGIKMLMGLVNEIGRKALNQYIKMEKNSVEFDVNKLLADNMKDVRVKSINISGEQIYAAIGFD